MDLRASEAEPRNFSNPAWPDGQAPPSHHPPRAPAVDLRRVRVRQRRRLLWDRMVEEFELTQRIAYDARIGDRSVRVTVPQADGRFTTDLTSVPSWFTWLVPKSGAHLPAALVHDGLVLGKEGVPRTYETSDGEPVDRIDADVVFRDAMRDTHVGLVRRWLVWAAVSIASLWLGARPVERWPRWRTWYFRGVVVATFGAILYLGTAATVELFDRDVRGLWNLPWMAGPWPLEVVGGLSGAVVVPLVVSVLWGSYARAGAIAGIALAALVHVTLAVGAVAIVYQLVELAANGRRRAPWVIGLGLAVAVGTFLCVMDWSRVAG